MVIVHVGVSTLLPNHPRSRGFPLFSQLLIASARAPQAKPDIQSVGGNVAIDLVAAASLWGESCC